MVLAILFSKLKSWDGFRLFLFPVLRIQTLRCFKKEHMYESLSYGKNKQIESTFCGLFMLNLGDFLRELLVWKKNLFSI